MLQVQETVLAKMAWILSRIWHFSEHLGNWERASQSRQGLFTK